MGAKAFRKLPSGIVRVTSEHMPFVGHKTCAQWGPRFRADPELPPIVRTDKDRRRDAERGSTELLVAIRRVA